MHHASRIMIVHQKKMAAGRLFVRPPSTGGGYLLSHFRSTIGVAGFNFSVRNGKRWSPRAITTLMCSQLRRYRLARSTVGAITALCKVKKSCRKSVAPNVGLSLAPARTRLSGASLIRCVCQLILCACAVVTAAGVAASFAFRCHAWRAFARAPRSGVLRPGKGSGD